MHLRKLTISLGAIGDKHEGLRHRAFSIAASLEEHRLRSVLARLFHQNHLFRRTTIASISLNEDKPLHGDARHGIAQIVPPRLLATRQHAAIIHTLMAAAGIMPPQ